MNKLRIGIVGMGFIGPHHLEAIRRLGFAEVTAIAGSSVRQAREKADQYFIEKSYGDWRQLVSDPDIDVVDVTTPTALHAPIALAAIEAGKHIIVDKPMALTSGEAKQMLDAAKKKGVVNAVTFSIRYNVMLQQLRAMIAKGDAGQVNFIQGHYFQEWLLRDTDFNWRIIPEKSGNLAMVADAGAHWYDMVQHVTGIKIVRVLADLSRFIETRKRPNPDGSTESFKVETPDLGMVMFEFENGARGLFSTGAIMAGHKNDLSLEVIGSEASLRWQQERPDELWIGRREEPSQVLLKDPPLLDTSVLPYTKLPGGHSETWTDAFRNLMQNILGFIIAKRDPREADGSEFPTFETGLGVARIIDAITKSADLGGQWTNVGEGD